MIKNNKELIAEIKGAVLALTDSLAYLAEGAGAEKASTGSKSKAKVSKAEEEEESGEDGDRRAELEAMSYNDLKALVSQLKGKAVGKKPELIELILELEGEGAEEEEEEETPKSKKASSAKGKKAKEEEPEEEEEEGSDEEEVTEEGMREQLADFEDDELKSIAKEMGIPTKGKTSKAIINLLVKDLEKLDETLEAMGYYEEEGSEEEGEEGESLADKLAEKDLEDLATICADNGISSKGKKQALIDRIVEAVENGDLEESDLDLDGEGSEEGEEGEEEGASVEEIVDELELADLKLVAKELGITVTKTSKAPALKKAILAEDEDAIIEALEANGLAGEAEEGDEEADEQDVEVSDDVLEAEAKLEKDLRAKIKAGKIKEPAMKKFLQEYYDGDPDCKYCNGECSKEERIECYIKIQKRFIDDECETHEASDPYTRGEEEFCCGKKLVAGKKKGTFVCEVCGEEYKFAE